MDSLSERMTHALSGIEEWLEHEFPMENVKEPTFRQRLSAARRNGRISKRDHLRLKDLWTVRGILNHEIYDGRPPVAASLPGLKVAEQMLERYTGKVPKVSEFDKGAGSVFTTRPTQKLGEVLKGMRQMDYSAVPVINEKQHFIALLTNDDIVQWLTKHFDLDGSILVEDVEVSAVMHEGGPDFDFISRDMPQRDARRLFQRSADEKGAPLMALLITKSGTSNEPLLGILTPWDLPYLTPSPTEEANGAARQ